MRKLSVFLVFLFSISMLPSLTQASIDDGLVLHLNFNEISEGKVADSSGNHNDGTIHNILEEDLFSGKLGKALVFNGIDGESVSYVQVADDDSLEGFSAFSMCGWGYLDSYNEVASNFISKSASPYNAPYQAPYALYEMYVSPSGVPNMAISNSGTFRQFSAEDSGSVVPLKTWTHMCGVYDGTEMKLYVNGVMDSALSPFTPGVIDSNDIDLLVGSYGASNSFNNWSGALDDMRIYNRALSQEEIKELYDLPNLDITAPAIILVGDAAVNLTVGNSYTDAGATALDNLDGDITANIITTGLPINTSAAGTFTIHYNVSDAAHNPAIELTRTVIVSAPPVVPLPVPKLKTGSRVVGNVQNTTTSAPSSSASVALSASATGSVGQVLGADSFHFTLVLNLGSEGNEVLELQKFLKKFGYYAGDIDGRYGWETMQAVIGFQIINKMVKTDGIVGKETRVFLNK